MGFGCRCELRMSRFLCFWPLSWNLMLMRVIKSSIISRLARSLGCIRGVQNEPRNLILEALEMFECRRRSSAPDLHSIADSEVLLARHRLTGALQDLVHQDADTASSEEDIRSKPNRTPIKKHLLENTPPRPAKAKRRRLGNETSTAHHQSYVMKLFDRSADLAQFEEDTPLYPICRAWMANQPRNPQIVVKRRLSSLEPNSKSLTVNGETDLPIGEVDQLPPPDPEMVNRVPSPLPEQIEKDASTDFLNYNTFTPPSREYLLLSHRQRWSNVRRKWQEQARKYEDRYHTSTNILTIIYHKAQENMV